MEHMDSVALHCKNCGADLPVPEDAEFVKCAYCNTAHQVERVGDKVTLKMLQVALERLEGEVKGLTSVAKGPRRLWEVKEAIRAEIASIREVDSRLGTRRAIAGCNSLYQILARHDPRKRQDGFIVVLGGGGILGAVVSFPLAIAVMLVLGTFFGIDNSDVLAQASIVARLSIIAAFVGCSMSSGALLYEAFSPGLCAVLDDLFIRVRVVQAEIDGCTKALKDEFQVYTGQLHESIKAKVPPGDENMTADSLAARLRNVQKGVDDALARAGSRACCELLHYLERPGWVCRRRARRFWTQHGGDIASIIPGIDLEQVDAAIGNKIPLFWLSVAVDPEKGEKLKKIVEKHEDCPLAVIEDPLGALKSIPGMRATHGA